MTTSAKNEPQWLGQQAEVPAGQAWEAVGTAHYNKLQRVLDTHGQEATRAVQGPIGHPVTPLGQAVRKGDTLAARMLLKASADPHERANGHTIASPMAWAIEAQSLGSVRLLLECPQWGRRKEPPAGEDWTELAVREHDHIGHPEPSILRTLLRAGIRPTQEALCRAVQQGKHASVQLLIDAGADVNEKDRRTGVVPVCLAIVLPGNTTDSETIGPRMLKMLLTAGANPNAWCGETGRHRPPAVVAAIEAGARWAVKMLLAGGGSAQGARDFVRSHGIRDSQGAGDNPIVNALEELL